MAKTIQDYKNDYAAAQARGDKAGMAAANNGANALRQQQGQAAQVADVTKEVYGNNYVGSPSYSSPYSGSNSGSSYGTTPGGASSGGYTPKKKTVYVKGKGAMDYWDYFTGGVDLSRRPDLAGQVISQGGTNVYYDENGYARKGTNTQHELYAGTDKSVLAPSMDIYNSTADRNAWGGSSYDQNHFSDVDLKNADYIRQKAEKGIISWDDANKYVESIRSKYGYSGGQDGSKYIPLEYNVWNPDSDQMVKAPFQGVQNTGVNYDWGGNIPSG